MDASRFFRYDEVGQIIEITAPVIEVFLRHQQTCPIASEAGGLLFAEICPSIIKIVYATEPTNLDIRSRVRFKSSRQNARSLIKDKFIAGLHFVGEWHTHPEEEPTPSRIDLDSMAESFGRSKHQLDHFIMVIIGNHARDLRLWVSLHNGINVLKLTEY